MTRPLMIVTQKVTTLAFQLHDGKADPNAFSTPTLTLFALRIVQIMLTYFFFFFSGMCKNSEELTKEQKLLAIK